MSRSAYGMPNDGASTLGSAHEWQGFAVIVDIYFGYMMVEEYNISLRLVYADRLQ